jgi:hypothetical protein
MSHLPMNNSNMTRMKWLKKGSRRDRDGDIVTILITEQTTGMRMAQSMSQKICDISVRAAYISQSIGMPPWKQNHNILIVATVNAVEFDVRE